MIEEYMGILHIHIHVYIYTFIVYTYIYMVLYGTVHIYNIHIYGTIFNHQPDFSIYVDTQNMVPYV